MYRYSRVLLIFLMLLSLSTVVGQNGSFKALPTYLEALKNFNSGNLEVALKQFKEALAADPGNDAADFYIANIYIQSDNLTKARQHILSAIKKDPSNVWYRLRLADIYRYSGKNREAIEVYNQLRREFPDRSELFDGLIQLYIQQKDYASAREVLEEIEKNIGVNEGTTLTRFNLLIFEGKQQEAIKYLRQFDSLVSSPRIATIIGDNYAMEDNNQLAETYYLKALSMDPGYIPASFGLGEIHRIRSEFGLYFERINPFLISPDIDEAMKVDYMRQILTNSRFVQTFLPQVDTMMQNLYRSQPTHPETSYLYSLFLAQTGETLKAADILLANLNRYPEDKEAHRQYLSLIYYLEKWDILEEKSDEALKILGNDTDFMQLKGIARLRMNRREDSIETFREILRYSKKDSTTTVNTLTTIADLSYQAGRVREAFKYYRKVLKKEPRHLPALNNYAYFLSIEGKSLQKALRMSKITIEHEPDNPTYLDTYAWILHKLGRNTEAKAALKHAMVYGGNENAVIVDHYAEVLFALKEYDLAFIYWSQADKLDPSLGIAEKAETRKTQMSQR